MGRSVANTGAKKLTYEDLVLFPDDGKRHEIVDGDHYMSAAPNAGHQRVLLNLSVALHAFARAHRLGQVFFAPFDVLLSRYDIVEPDLLFISAARAEVLTAANVQGPPDLTVEVLSPSSRRYDELLKRDLYERTGIAEYWIVDPEAETVKVFRRGGERFGRPLLLSLRDGDVLATPLLPGLELPLAALFEE